MENDHRADDPFVQWTGFRSNGILGPDRQGLSGARAMIMLIKLLAIAVSIGAVLVTRIPAGRA